MAKVSGGVRKYIKSLMPYSAFGKPQLDFQHHISAPVPVCLERTQSPDPVGVPEHYQV